VAAFTGLREEFDRLAGAYVVATLHELGWRPRPGDAVSTAHLAGQLKVVRAYERLLGRLLQMLAEDGILEQAEEGWRVVRPPVPANIGAQHGELLRRYPSFEADLKLAHRCGTRMSLVLRGEADPLDVLFGDEAAAWAEWLYRQSPLAQFYNELVAGSVRELVGRLAGRRPVRILEVGGGTGGTTAHVLPVLPAERVEYVFTDVSKLFVAQASARFQPFPFVRYQVLDVEKEPGPQGFADGQFDLILAANVLHATSDLRHSLRTVRRLLALEGVLVLLEGTGPRRLLDLIFGLTEGWWKFADLDLRPSYPLLPPSAWVKLLGEEGFTDCAAVPAPDHELPDPDQVVLLARSDIGVSLPASGRPTRAPATWVIAGDRLGLADDLAARLKQDGDAVVWPGLTYEPDAAVATGGSPVATAAAVHLVDFTDEALAISEGVREGNGETPAFAATWIVTRGAAPWRPDGQTADRFLTWQQARTRQQAGRAVRLIDLDPAQTPGEQVACLHQALCYPDEQLVVVYRDDQRYVPATPTKPGPGTPACAAGVPAQAAVLERDILLAAHPAQRRQLIQEHLQCEFRSVLGLTLAPADLDRPPQAFGLDSLTGIQLRNRLEARLGISLSVVDFLKGLSLNQIIDKAAASLVQESPGESPPVAARSGDRATTPDRTTTESIDQRGQTVTPPPPSTDLTSEGVDQLPEERLDALLDTLLR
jgi:SAM-dependent methyltransferase